MYLRSAAAAAAAKSLQSCPTLCDPIDSSPPGSPVPGILQARTLEWVAISFSNLKGSTFHFSTPPLACWLMIWRQVDMFIVSNILTKIESYFATEARDVWPYKVLYSSQKLHNLTMTKN